MNGRAAGAGLPIRRRHSSSSTAAVIRAGQLLRIVDLVDPIEKRHWVAPVVLDVAVEEMVENPGPALPKMAIAQGQLLLCFGQRHAFAQMPVQHAHQPGPVGAGLAMQQHGILDALEQLGHSLDVLALRCEPRAELEVDQCDAVPFADRLLERVATAKSLAAKIDDGAQALPRERAEIVRGRLSGAPGPRAEPMLVDVQQAEDTVVENEHVQITAGGPEQPARPRRGAIGQLSPPDILHTLQFRGPPPCAFCNPSRIEAWRLNGHALSLASAHSDNSAPTVISLETNPTPRRATVGTYLHSDR